MPYPINYNLMNPQQQYMNMFNPQLQQPMQQQIPVQNNLSTGKIVDSLEIVKVTDIPMDGNAYYFPKADGSEVYAKRWLANGKTEIIRFVKAIETDQEEIPKPFDFELMQNNIFERLDAIDDRMQKLEKGLVSRTSTKAQKE
jgi:hypothetical protein